MDAKGRMLVPLKFRAGLSEKFTITKGLDGCIFVFPQGEWETLEAKLSELPLADSHIKRFFLGSKEEVELDKQGRILLPQHLREHARLEKDIVSVGVGNRVEIWDKASWKKLSEKFTLAPDELIVKLENLGI
jgi:MraZ protein